MSQQPAQPKWEMVIASREPSEYLERLKVPGGWLYRTQVDNGTDDGWSVAMCFVPDTPTEHRSL